MVCIKGRRGFGDGWWWVRFPEMESELKPYFVEHTSFSSVVPFTSVGLATTRVVF
jgi:hypothetical protein